MRRLVAVFSKRDKPDSHHQSDRSHPPSKKPPKLPLAFASHPAPSPRTPSSITSTPQLSSVSDHGQSSGSSSSGSASLSLRTPEETPKTVSLTRSLTKRSWKDWLGKRSEPDPPTIPPPSKPSDSDRSVPPERNKGPPTLHDPRTRPRIANPLDDTDDATSSESEDEESVSMSDHPLSPATFAASPARARQNLTLLIQNELAPLPSASPFVQHSATFLFPRSCNRPQALPLYFDVRRTMFRRRLLKQLGKLSADDQKTISPFASKRIPSPIRVNSLPDFEASHPPNTTRIFSASPGLRRWISRPCFEERFTVFVPLQGGDIHRIPVSSALAVAALEYSEFLDVMVDPDFDPSSPPPDMLYEVPWKLSDHISLKPTDSPSVSTNDVTLVPPQITNTKHSHNLPPSPLRTLGNIGMGSSYSPAQPALTIAKSPVAPLVHSSSQASILRQKQEAPPSPTPPSPLPTQLEAVAPVKRVVRFVEEDDGEDVPLLLIRQKKKREEKAKFLRAEQRRRLMEQEQERRRLEVEAMEKERNRLVREKDRREVEQRQYAEMVSAARERREMQRGGIIPGLKTDSNNLLLSSPPSSTSLRETERDRPRDPRRQSLVPHHTGSSSVPRRERPDSDISPYPQEATNYFPGSGGYSPGGSNSGHGHYSRPGSMYSSSSEDGRHTKRQSSASNNFLRPSVHHATSSTWSGSNQSLINVPPMPVVPPLPELMNDFILLPPSAPFMMHQHPRQSRNSSPGHSNSSGSLRGYSANSSSERVSIRRQSSQSQEAFSAPPSPGGSPGRTDPRPMHMRHGSGDSRRLSVPLSAVTHGSSSRSQPSSLSRGRPQIPHSQSTPGIQYQPVNPWTALPSQYGALPTAMPVSLYSHSMNSSYRGQPSGGSVKKNSWVN